MFLRYPRAPTVLRNRHGRAGNYCPRLPSKKSRASSLTATAPSDFGCAAGVRGSAARAEGCCARSRSAASRSSASRSSPRSSSRPSSSESSAESSAGVRSGRHRRRLGEAAEDEAGDRRAHQRRHPEEPQLPEGPGVAEDGRRSGPGGVEGGVADCLAELQQDGQRESHGEGCGGLGGVAREVVPRKTATSRAAPRTSTSRTPAMGAWMMECSPKPAVTVSKAARVSSILGTVRRTPNSARAPAAAPTSCAPRYAAASGSRMRPAMALPTVTAGLKWPPEM